MAPVRLLLHDGTCRQGTKSPCSPPTPVSAPPQVARRWRFKTEEASLARLQVGARLPNASLRDVAAALVAKQYRVGTGGGWVGGGEWEWEGRSSSDGQRLRAL